MPGSLGLQGLGRLGDALGRGKIDARLGVAPQRAYRGAARVGAQLIGHGTTDGA